MKRTRIRWISQAGTYAIDSVREMPTEIDYIGTDGQKHGRIPATRIVGVAAGSEIIGVSVGGSHDRTLANYRAAMARKIQVLGGSWMGRSEAGETAHAQAIVDSFEAKPGESIAEARKRIRSKDAYYDGIPHRSNY